MATPLSPTPHQGTIGRPDEARQKQADKAYCDWSCHVSYLLYQFSYQTEAIRALLHEYEHAEADETLTGVSYLLSQLSDGCKDLGTEVGDTMNTYTRKPEAQHG